VIRVILPAVLGVLCLIGSAQSGLLDAFKKNEIDFGQCGEFTRHPKEGKVALSGCVLEVDETLLVNKEGEVERFSMRKKGQSTHPLGNVEWVSAFAPVADPHMSQGRTTVLYNLSTPEVLKFFNRFEQSSEDEKIRLLQNNMLLKRMENPSVLMGSSKRPKLFESLQAALGTTGTPFLFVVEPGRVDESAPVPTQGIFLAILGCALLIFSVASRPKALDEVSGPGLDTSKVEVKMGELDALKNENKEH
jgi:hypothetical protein